MVLRSIEIHPVMTRCYLLGDEKENVCAVADPGGEPERVLDMVRDSGMDLKMVLLTHGHYDHVLGVPGLLEARPGLPVYIHRADFEAPDPRLFPLKDALGGLSGVRFYGGGDALALGSLEIRVLHTAGHSAGSVTLLAEDAMLCGDTLFAGSCGRCDLTGGSEDGLFRSLKRLGELAGDYRVCPGHGESSTLDCERAVNPYLRRAMAL